MRTHGFSLAERLGRSQDHRPSLACRALASNRQNARNAQVLTRASR